MKVLQVIERDGKHDEALKEQLEQQGLDPGDCQLIYCDLITAQMMK